MHSATSKTPTCFMRLPAKLTNPKPRQIQLLKPRKENGRQSSFKSLKYVHNSESNLESLSSSLIPSTHNPSSLLFCSSVTANKLQSLASEFKALSEPIDRVKRLLCYAALLPPFEESARLEANRVNGCTTQVWLEARMDSGGLMRFRADSDSEITKGFCSCLIWVLDTAAPEEVMAVKAEDLEHMNVGLSGRTYSRVNTWHNVLMSMQKRTKALVEERESEQPSEPFPSMVVKIDDITANGTYASPQMLAGDNEGPVCGPELSEAEPTPRVLTILSFVLEKLVGRNDQLAVGLSQEEARNEGVMKWGSVRLGKSLNAFHGVRAPSISIGKYLERIYKYTNCSPSCFVVGYVYIDRLVHRHPDSLVFSLNVHRLLVTSVMVASKILDDVHYNNAFYARVGGVSKVELNKLELELLFLLDFGVTVSSRVFESYCLHLEKEMLWNGTSQKVKRPLTSNGVAGDETEISVEDKHSSSPPPMAE